MNANKLKNNGVKVILTIFSVFMLLIVQKLPVLADSTQDIKIQVIDYDTKQLISGVSIIFNKNSNFDTKISTAVNPTSESEIYNYMVYGVNNGRNFTIDVNNIGYEIYNMYCVYKNKTDCWIYNGQVNPPYVINGNVRLIKIELKQVHAPRITSPQDGTVTNNNKPAIIGTAEANSTVKVYDRTTLIGSVIVDVDGNWTLTPTVDLSYGLHVISATATDTTGNVSRQSNIVNITINKTNATMNLKRVLSMGAFTGTEFEIKYTIIPNDILLVNSNDLNSKELIVRNLKFNEVLPEGLILNQSKVDSSKLDITLNENTLSANIVPKITYTLDDSTKTKYTAKPISFSVWVSSNLINTYNMSGENSYITYDDIDNISQKANFNDLQIIVNGYSDILKHGIFNGNFNNISIKEEESGLSITKSIPVTLAMMADINSINPIINLNISDSTKISESNISFKKYEIITDGNISNDSVEQLTLNINGGNIKLSNDAFKMEPNKRYIIIYTIIPKGDANINIKANIVGTDKVKNVGLNIKDLPDLY